MAGAAPARAGTSALTGQRTDSGCATNLADFGLGVDTDEPLFEHHRAPTSPAQEAQPRATAIGIVDLLRAAIPDTGTAVLPHGSQHPDGAHHTTGSDLPVVVAPLIPLCVQSHKKLRSNEAACGALLTLSAWG